MVKKWIAVFSMLCIFALLSVCGEKRSFTIEKVDIRAQIMEDGDLFVEELYTYRFKGEHLRTTRSLASKGHDGVEFFEAFIPPDDARLGHITYSNTFPLRTELEEGTYRVYNYAYDQTKQVYYRYRLNQAARKYLDVAEWYWAFFDSENEADLHQLSVEIILPQTIGSDKVDIYVHDRTGGHISQVAGRSIFYSTELMPARETSEFRILFPAGWLPDAPLAEDTAIRGEVRAEEQKLGTRFAQRAQKLDQARSLINMVSVVLVMVIVYFAFLIPYKLARYIGGRVNWEKMEELDPLFVAYVYRNGTLLQKDTIAGLFSLYRKGMLNISKVPAQSRYLNDPKAPDETFQFTFIGDENKLNDYERDFVDWLFPSSRNEDRSITLESISGPTRKEESDARAMASHRKRKQQFDERFAKWKQKVLNHEQFSPYYDDNRAIVWAVPSLTIFIYAMTLYVYYANVSSWSAFGWAAVLMGGFAVAAIVFLRKVWVFNVYCVFCFVTIAQITHSEATFSLTGTLILAIIVRLLLPPRVPSKQGTPYKAAIGKWRNALKRESYPAGNELSRLEKLMQYALLFGISKSFARRHAPLVHDEELKSAFPLISAPDHTSRFFDYMNFTWRNGKSAKR